MRVPALVFSMVALTLLASGTASGARPAPVSPGGVTGFATVASPCPTFSWSAVEDATGYELVVYAAPAEVGPDAEGELGVASPVLRTRITGQAQSWTPSAESCLELSGSYAWAVRALGELEAGDWSEGAFFRIDAGPVVRRIAEVLERALGGYLEQRGAGAPASGLLAALIERELESGTPAAPLPGSPGPRMVSFQGRLVPTEQLVGNGPVASAPFFTDEPELTLAESGTSATDYTMLQLENPANALDWAWTVSSATGNLFLTSPAAGADGISFEVTGPIDVTTTVNFLKTTSDATIGSNTNQGELDIMDLTVAGLGTTLCIDSAGPSKVGRCTSSIRYKEEVDDLALGLDTVLKLRPVSFRWKSDRLEDLGFVAEEVAAVDPLLTTYDEVAAAPSVKYRRLTALLARAIQDLNGVIEEQRREIESLKAVVAATR